MARLVAMVLYASGAAGLAYGVVQRDPLFFVGQVCLLAIYFRLQRQTNDNEY